MYYIALIEAYLRGEKEDNWFSSNYMQSLQILITREHKRLEKEGGEVTMHS